MKTEQRKFSVLEGGRNGSDPGQHRDGQNDRQLFERLLKEPHAFVQQEFEDLIERFRSQLSIDDILAITAKRVRGRKDTDPLERDTLLAIIEGRFDESDRLLNVIERRNRLGLTVLTREPASPPQSSRGDV